jgi:hypothetical protein
MKATFGEMARAHAPKNLGLVANEGALFLRIVRDLRQ